MNKNNSNKTQETIYINGKMAIAVLVTFVMLIGCLVPMFVGLAMDASDGGGGIPAGGGGGSVNAGLNTPVDTSDAPTSGSKLSLPSATAAGSYLCAADASTASIEGITSAAAVLIDITDGKAVAQKNADVKIYPASMTKVMTLLVACERAKDPNALLTVTKDMVDKYAKSENTDASIAFPWKEGDQVTVEDALHLVIYESDTYACWLLADYIAGGEAAFVSMMNEKARALGLTSTNFTNCTGLYNKDHYTTCREMAAIMGATMNNPAAYEVITSTQKYTVSLYANGQKTEENGMWCAWYTSRLEKYRWGNAAAYYAGAGSDIKIISGKTGYEVIPSYCFVTSGIDTETGRKYVCVQVGRTESGQPEVTPKISTDDTRIIYQKYAIEQ